MAVTAVGNVLLSPLAPTLDAGARVVVLNPVPGTAPATANQAGRGTAALIANTQAMATGQAAAGADLINFPTYQLAQAATATAATRTQAPTVQATTQAETTTIDTTALATAAETDPLPGMLQVAYRAPLAASLYPLAGLRGEPPPPGPGPLDIVATLAIPPMGAQPGRQLFNPRLTGRQPAAVEAVAAYRAQTKIGVGPSEMVPAGGAGAAGRPSLNLVG